MTRQVRTPVSESGIPRKRCARIEELFDSVVGGINIVLGDVLPNFVKVAASPFAQYILSHLRARLRSRDFCCSRLRTAAGSMCSPRSSTASLAPIS